MDQNSRFFDRQKKCDSYTLKRTCNGHQAGFERIILAPVAAVAAVDPEKMTAHVGGMAFINKMYSERRLDVMIRHYTQELHEVIGYELVAQNDLLSLLNELATLDFRRVRVVDVKPDHLDDLSSWIAHYLTYTLTGMSPSTKQWNQLLREVWIAAVFGAQGGPIDVDELMPEIFLQGFIEAYAEKNPLKFKDEKSRKEMVNSMIETRQRVFGDLSTRYAQLREFLSRPHEAIGAVLDKLIEYTMVTDTEAYLDPSIPATLAAMTQFLIPREGFRRVAWSVKLVIDTLKGRKPRTSDHRLRAVAALMKIFVTARDSTDVNIAKASFLYYFRGENFGPRHSPEVLNFLITKYRKEHLRFFLPSLTDKYPVLLKIYAVDMITASMQSTPDFIRTTDLHYAFQNFLFFAEETDPRIFEAIDGIRGLFESNRHLLADHYELFNGLYDTAIFSSDYLVTWYFGMWKNYPYLFDCFLDRLIAWENGRFLRKIWGWQPDTPFFAINIKTNYAFYKLVNLRSHIGSLTSADVEFKKFEPRDDTLIHRLTLDPAYRPLVDFLGKKLGVKGFNYQKFTEKKVTRDLVREYIAHQKRYSDAKAAAA